MITKGTKDAIPKLLPHPKNNCTLSGVVTRHLKMMVSIIRGGRVGGIQKVITVLVKSEDVDKYGWPIKSGFPLFNLNTIDNHIPTFPNQYFCKCCQTFHQTLVCHSDCDQIYKNFFKNIFAISKQNSQTSSQIPKLFQT